MGDEAWEVDYYLHENPELKRTPFVWLTDFVGWLPMNTGTGWASGPTSGWSSPRWAAPPSASTSCAR